MDYEQEWELSPARRKPQFSKMLRVPAILDTLVEARRRSLQDVAQALSEVTRRFRSYKLESGEFDQLRLNKPRLRPYGRGLEEKSVLAQWTPLANIPVAFSAALC